MKRLAVALVVLLPACSTLDTMVPIKDPATGEVIDEVRLGDLAADAVDAYAQPTASVLSTVVPNPVVGAGLGGALLAMAGAASAALRKKKQTPPSE